MKNTTAFRPNKGRYLVLPDDVKGQETKIEGSEYTIESAKDIHSRPAEGTVIAKGKECAEYEPGVKVLFGKYSGYPQQFDGVEYLILAETEILGERLVTPFDEVVYPASLGYHGKIAEALCDGKHDGPACHELCWINQPL